MLDRVYKDDRIIFYRDGNIGIAVSLSGKDDDFFMNIMGEESLVKAGKQNRKRLLQMVSKGNKIPVICKQIHSSNIHIINNEIDVEKVDEIVVDNCDGIITNKKELAPGILTADCTPLLLYTEDVIAALHCGWRGVYNGIIRNAIHIFDYVYNIKPHKIKAFVGFGICGGCYEVGNEFIDIFGNSNIIKSKGKIYFDLKSEIRDTLISLGIREEDIFTLLLCSYHNSRLYSHRRGDSGRNISMIFHL